MYYDYVNITCVSPQTNAGDIEHNTAAIQTALRELSKGNSNIIVFPELSITGYSCGDLFHNTNFLNKALESLTSISEMLMNSDMIATIGLPILLGSKLYNCAAVVSGSGINGIVPKTHIPNYREFYEARWFSSSKLLQANTTLYLNGQLIPVGTDLIFEDPIKKIKFAVEICEDLWAPIPTSSYRSLAGAQIILNLSASNELIGKSSFRSDLVKHQSAKCQCAYVYTSCNPGDSSAELVYSGYQIIAELGKMLINQRNLTFQTKYTSASVDIGAIRSERMKNNSFEESISSRNIPIQIVEKVPNLQSRNISATPFVPNEKNECAETCNEVLDLLSVALANKIKSVGMLRPVIGISGGLDSTLALLAARQACDILEIDQSHIIGISMPGFGTSSATFKNAKNLVKAVGAEYKEIDIKEICESMFNAIGHEKSELSVTFENVQARTRTSILMNYSNKYDGFVLGTGDLSESALGWCTYNGDHTSMYNINTSVPKTLIKSIIKTIADKSENELADILTKILDTPISPELLPINKKGKIEQRTEDKLGNYEIHDFILFYLLRYNFSAGKIRFLANHAFKNIFEKEELDKAFRIFYDRFLSSQFKRSTLPEGPKIGTICLSPRGDWRLPSDLSPNALD